MKETFVIHTNSWENIKTLSKSQLGTLFEALMMHQRGEDLPEMDAVTDMAYMFMASQVDRDNEKYDQMVEKRRAAANARWHPDAYMQVHNVQCLNDNDNDNVNVNDYISLIMPDGIVEELKPFFGDRTEALLEDVKRYYEAHPEREFPGWAQAVTQFNANQVRWGKKKRGDPTARALTKFMEGADD